MILLDSHDLLWLRAGDDRLGPVALGEIQQAWEPEDLAVSAISCWEMAILRNRRRINYPMTCAFGGRTHWSGVWPRPPSTAGQESVLPPSSIPMPIPLIA